MRADKELSYTINNVLDPPEIFKFIAKETGNKPTEMYGNYNMGAGYAIYLPKEQVTNAITIAEKCGLKAWEAGTVEDGPQQVKIEPLSIVFDGNSLGVR